MASEEKEFKGRRFRRGVRDLCQIKGGYRCITQDRDTEKEFVAAETKSEDREHATFCL